MAKTLHINTAWCKGCDICVALCPRKTLVLRQEKVVQERPEDCVFCALCELRCPDFAIFVEEAAE